MKAGVSTCPDGEEEPPLTPDVFCLHNGLTMLRRFDRLTSRTDQTTRTVAGPGQPLKAARDDRQGEGGSRYDTGTITRTKPKTQRPNLYRVLLLNDDYTPMEFVVHVLERFFSKSREEATTIMLHVHRRGVGVCGVFTYEVAETKVTQVMDFARQHQHPLQCTLEKD